MQDGSLIPRFGRARRDPTLAVLEGFHPVKHALRFGASVQLLVTSDPDALRRLAETLAPDLAAEMLALAREVEIETFRALSPLAPTTPVMALAERPAFDLAAVLSCEREAPVILLEDPRDLGNMGACVRVAAAADAAGVLTTGSHDPWHPDALRGAAGLHFALPVGRLGEDLSSLAAGPGPAEAGRPLIALDPAGEPLEPSRLPARALLAFGTERRGLSEELTRSAQQLISIPMREGVSSLNLATSVAAVLFSWRASRPVPDQGA